MSTIFYVYLKGDERAEERRGEESRRQDERGGEERRGEKMRERQRKRERLVFPLLVHLKNALNSQDKLKVRCPGHQFLPMDRRDSTESSLLPPLGWRGTNLKSRLITMWDVSAPNTCLSVTPRTCFLELLNNNTFSSEAEEGELIIHD